VTTQKVHYKMKTKPIDGFVKKFPLLFIDKKHGACLLLPDGSHLTLPDTPFSRWFIRTQYEHANATPEGRAWYAKHDPMRYVKIPQLIHPPKAFQILSLSRMAISNCGLWLDMGLGKSFVSLAFALQEFNAGRGCMSLVVCPPTIFGNWIDEIHKHVLPFAKVEVLIAHGDKRKKRIQELRIKNDGGFKIILTSYETLRSVFDDLITLPIHTIFLDESSRIKNYKSKRSMAASELTKALPNTRRFLLSGTPSTTSPLGFYAQYEFAGRGFSGSPDAVTYENTYATTKLFIRAMTPSRKTIHAVAETDEDLQRWLETHGEFGSSATYATMGYTFGRKPGPTTIRILNYYRRTMGFKNLKQLRQISLTHSYTVKKEDVLDDLPPKVYIKRTIKMTTEQKKAYTDCFNANAIILGKTRLRFNDQSSPHIKLHQIAQGFVLDENRKPHYFPNNPKIAELNNILDETGEQRIVVWCAYRDQLEQVANSLRVRKISFREIHGGVPIKDRPEVIRAFTSPSPPRVLLGNPAVGGMGLNMTWATIEVFMSIWFSPDVRNQAEDRLHRIGQKNAVTIIDLLAESSFEPKLLRDTKNKIDLENQITGAAVWKGD